MRAIAFVFAALSQLAAAQTVISYFSDSACATAAGTITVPFSTSLFNGCFALSSDSQAAAKKMRGSNSDATGSSTYYYYNDYNLSPNSYGAGIYTGSSCSGDAIITFGSASSAPTACTAASTACSSSGRANCVGSYKCTSGCTAGSSSSSGGSGGGSGIGGGGFSGLGSLGNAASCGSPPSSTASSGICPITGGGSTDPASCAYANCVFPGSCNCAGPIAGIVIGVILGLLILIAVLMRVHVIPHPACLDRFFGDGHSTTKKGGAATAAKAVGGENPMTRK